MLAVAAITPHAVADRAQGVAASAAGWTRLCSRSTGVRTLSMRRVGASIYAPRSPAGGREPPA